MWVRWLGVRVSAESVLRQEIPFLVMHLLIFWLGVAPELTLLSCGIFSGGELATPSPSAATLNESKIYIWRQLQTKKF